MSNDIWLVFQKNEKTTLTCQKHFQNYFHGVTMVNLLQLIIKEINNNKFLLKLSKDFLLFSSHFFSTFNLFFYMVFFFLLSHFHTFSTPPVLCRHLFKTHSTLLRFSLTFFLFQTFSTIFTIPSSHLLLRPFLTPPSSSLPHTSFFTPFSPLRFPRPLQS